MSAAGALLLRKNARSAAVRNPRTELFGLPATDMSIQSSRDVTANPTTTGITPISFEFTSSSYLDLNRSYILLELQLKNAADAANLAQANQTFLANNLAHTLFKQLVLRLNGALITPQTDAYHHLAFIETLMNHDIEDCDDLLTLQGYYDCLNVPDDGDGDEITANQQNFAHDDYKALDDDKKRMILDRVKYLGGNRVSLRLKPALEVFRLSKLMVPNVQIQLQMYLNDPAMWTIKYHGAVAPRLTEADISAKLVLRQVELQPNVNAELRKRRIAGAPCSYPVVRSAIRTFNLANDQRVFECQDPFYKQVPNRIIVALVKQAAFNGDNTLNPFNYGKYNLSTVKLTINGEEYPYSTLELNHNNGNKDVVGYGRFLEATGCISRGKGNLVKRKDWGHGKRANLLAFDTTANKTVDSPVLNPEQKGDVRLILNFGANPGANLTVLVYGEFENVIEVAPNGVVTYDIHS